MSAHEDICSISYVGWDIVQIDKNLETEADLTGGRNLIINLNPKWLNGEDSSVLNVMRDLERLCESVHRKWPELHLHLIGLFDDVVFRIRLLYNIQDFLGH